MLWRSTSRSPACSNPVRISPLPHPPDVSQTEVIIQNSTVRGRVCECGIARPWGESRLEARVARHPHCRKHHRPARATHGFPSRNRTRQGTTALCECHPTLCHPFSTATDPVPNPVGCRVWARAEPPSMWRDPRRTNALNTAVSNRTHRIQRSPAQHRCQHRCQRAASSNTLGRDARGWTPGRLPPTIFERQHGRRRDTRTSLSSAFDRVSRN